MSKVTDDITFLLGMLLPDMLVHESLVERVATQDEVSIACRTSQSFIKFQILMVRQHLKNKCAPLSCTRWQSGQRPQFSQPRLASRSAIQIQS